MDKKGMKEVLDLTPCTEIVHFRKSLIRKYVLHAIE